MDAETLALVGRMIWAKTRPLLAPAPAVAAAGPTCTLGGVTGVLGFCRTIPWLNGSVRGELLGFTFISGKSGLAATEGEEEGGGGF